MKKHLKTLLCAVAGAVSISAFAQQDAQFSQYMYNSLYINPGNAGIEGNPRFTAFHRSQWVGYGNGVTTPTTQVFTASLPVLALKGGLGVQVVHDLPGGASNLRNIDFQVSYSYHLKIAGGKLGLGIRTGVFSRSNSTQYEATDAKDPVVDKMNNQSVSGINPDFALGAFYYHNKWYAGASLNHLVQFKYSDVYTQARRHSYFTAGYNFLLSSALVVTPSILFKYDNTKFSSDYSAKFTYNTRYWAGLSFRQEDAIIPFIGLSMLKNNALSVGYALDLTLINASGKSSSSHEIMLLYQLPQVLPVIKPVIRTPRYRF